MPKHKLQVTPKCIKCKAPTRHFTSSENIFLNRLFLTEWFKCIDCGKVQAKIVKILRDIHGFRI